MPYGIYPRTQYHKSILSEARKRGIEKGTIKIWNKNRICTAEERKKISESHKGIKQKPRSKEYCMAISVRQIGRIFSEDTRSKMSQSRFKGIAEGRINKIPSRGFVKGFKPWNTNTRGLIVSWSKGLTKRSDARLKIAGEKQSLTKEERFGNVEYKNNFLNKNKGKFISPLEKDKVGRIPSNFNNYSSYDPYNRDFNKAFKQAVISRDSKCIVCGVSISLSIHHVNYDKLVSLKENCVCLCNSCHAKTNFNRAHWIKFFQSILSERYGYKYSDDNKLILEIQ